LRLAIEVDGPIHATQREHDRERSRILEAHGVTVLRVSNEQVAKDLDAALSLIRSTVAELSRSSGFNPPAPDSGAGRRQRRRGGGAR
jgi:very-short-patch-repair endonuclease